MGLFLELFLGLFFTIFIFSFFSGFRRKWKYKKLKTFQEYSQEFGKKCNSCDSTQIYIKTFENRGTKLLNIHQCRVCGKVLYRSEGRI
nr:hypothetical protein [uncultured Cetobacterium sp.]